MKKIIIVLVAASIASAVLGQGVLIQNAGFESPTVSGSDGGGTSTAYAPTGAGWTFVNNANAASGVIATGTSEAQSYWTSQLAPEGSQIGFIQEQGYFVQDVTVTNAGFYQVFFDVGGRIQFLPGVDGTQSYEVLWDGSVVYTGNTVDNQTFAPVNSPAFFTTSGSHSLQFQGLTTTGDHTALFDAISAVAVPEPSSAGLLMVGGIIAASMLAMKRKTA
jgi:hypothetical protein